MFNKVLSRAGQLKGRAKTAVPWGLHASQTQFRPPLGHQARRGLRNLGSA
jgi:hypothetical protein